MGEVDFTQRPAMPEEGGKLEAGVKLVEAGERRAIFLVDGQSADGEREGVGIDFHRGHGDGPAQQGGRRLSSWDLTIAGTIRKPTTVYRMRGPPSQKRHLTGRENFLVLTATVFIARFSLIHHHCRRMFDIFIQRSQLHPVFVCQRRKIEICDLFGFLRMRIQRRQIVRNPSGGALGQKSL